MVYIMRNSLQVWVESLYIDVFILVTNMYTYYYSIIHV